jgi:hypothetical protein
MIRFADDTQRTSIVGATGSGKTIAALWHLSMKNYNQKPWVIYDFKTDEAINEIENAHHSDVSEDPPETPGIYIVHPHPSQIPEVEEQMWKIWERGDTGVYIDEGYMVGNNNKAFRALLTQGRSRHIPMIVLSQRPVWMDRFVFSESEFFQIFRLQHKKDYENVQQFVPIKLKERLPEFHSYYYDVGMNRVTVLKPVPDKDATVHTINTRLQRLQKVV